MYLHTNKVNGKKYVGLTKQKPENRWGKDGRNYKNSSPHFWSAIQKYGWDKFEHLVIASDLTKDGACAIEIALIKKFQTQNRDFGYNIMPGGDAPEIPAEVREKMSRSMTGNKNGLGHKCSEEKKRKISEAQKGRRLTDDHKRKLSEAKKGKPHGSMSAETKRKISDSHKKRPVYCQETDTVYPSIQECARQLGLWATLIVKVCKGTLKTTGGYHLSYYEQHTINV